MFSLIRKKILFTNIRQAHLSKYLSFHANTNILERINIFLWRLSAFSNWIGGIAGVYRGFSRDRWWGSANPWSGWRRIRFRLFPKQFKIKKYIVMSWARNLRQGIVMKTSFWTRISQMGLPSFVDIDIFVLKYYFI